MRTHVEFRSTAFPPRMEDEEEVNPERWGKLLADFLVESLRKHGYSVACPVAEDWGWRLAMDDSEGRVWIGTGNYEQYEDGFLVFVERRQSLVGRLFKSHKDDSLVERLVDDLDMVLRSHPEIRDVSWWPE